MTGLGRSTIYRMEAVGQFPQRLKLGLRAVGWMESEVQAWLTMRAKARRRPGPTRWPLNDERLAGLVPSDRH